MSIIRPGEIVALIVCLGLEEYSASELVMEDKQREGIDGPF